MPAHDSQPLFSRSWLPTGGARAHVVIAHGYAEHSGRYESLARAFNDAGYHVHAYDHRGHGHSPGRRGEISEFSALISDLRRYIDHIGRIADGGPLFILGHSMGGLVTAHYLATQPRGIHGAVFSSPLMAIPDHVSPLLLRVSRLLSAITPRLPVERLDSKCIASDHEVVRAYDVDPLVYRGPIRARTGAELAHAIQALPSLLPRITLPLLVFHGAADRIAPVAGSRRLYEGAGGNDKECFFVEDGFHELLNDTGREETIAKVLDWLNRHGAMDGTRQSRT